MKIDDDTPTHPGRSGAARRRCALQAALIVALTLLAYAPTWQAGFVWDDDDYVNENRPCLDSTGCDRIWFELEATPQYYPLVHTTYWLEHRSGGWSPRLPRRQRAAARGLRAPAVEPAAALRRARGLAGGRDLRPASRDVESVAWITERKNVLSLRLLPRVRVRLPASARSHPPTPSAPSPAVAPLRLAAWRSSCARCSARP